MYFSFFRLVRVLRSSETNLLTGMPASTLTVATGLGVLLLVVGFVVMGMGSEFVVPGLWVSAAGAVLLGLSLVVAVVQALIDIARTRRD